MGKREKMRNTATVVLMLSVGVLGLLLYSQTVALREQRRQVQEPGAKTASLAVQENCAKRAREEFSEHGWGGDGTSLESHYNQKLNRCFMRVKYVDRTTSAPDWWVSIWVYDAFEGRGYGSYSERVGAARSVSACWVELPSGETAGCRSRTEFHELVKQYME